MGKYSLKRQRHVLFARLGREERQKGKGRKKDISTNNNDNKTGIFTFLGAAGIFDLWPLLTFLPRSF